MDMRFSMTINNRFLNSFLMIILKKRSDLKTRLNFVYIEKDPIEPNEQKFKS